MKYFFLFLFLLPLMVSAQDSCKLKTTTDPFTHITRISTGFVPFNTDGIPLSISIDVTKTEIDFFLWFRDGSKCFDETSTIQIIYEGERLKANFKNTGSMNCEGAFHFTFRNSSTTHSQLRRITEKKISTMKLVGNNKEETEIKLSEEQKVQLQKMAICIVSQSKSLL